MGIRTLSGNVYASCWTSSAKNDAVQQAPMLTLNLHMKKTHCYLAGSSFPSIPSGVPLGQVLGKC